MLGARRNPSPFVVLEHPCSFLHNLKKKECYVDTRKQVLTVALSAVFLSSAIFAVQSSHAADEQAPMTFFVTSSNHDGNLGGLEGADAICQRLAEAAGSPATRTWRAYLSTQGANAVNARDRIGSGPWHNADGVQIAANVDDLHGDVERDRNYLFVETALDENGERILGRERPEGSQNDHDIMTGSTSRGMAFPAGEDRTCSNWTSDGGGSAMVGHHDRSGGGNTSWNSVHPSRACDTASLNATGGNGKFYCFATN